MKKKGEGQLLETRNPRKKNAKRGKNIGKSTEKLHNKKLKTRFNKKDIKSSKKANSSRLSA